MLFHLCSAAAQSGAKKQLKQRSVLCEWKDLESACPGQTVAMSSVQVFWILSDNTRSRISLGVFKGCMLNNKLFPNTCIYFDLKD